MHPGVFPARVLVHPGGAVPASRGRASKGWAGGMQSLPASPSLGSELIAPPLADTTRSALDV